MSEVPLWLTERFVPRNCHDAVGYLDYNDEGPDPQIELTFYYRKNKGDEKRRVDVLLGITKIGDVPATEPVPWES